MTSIAAALIIEHVRVEGMMLTGWQLIDGKWYYFSEAEGSGTMGALYRNTTTPDGYRVDGAGVWIQEPAAAS